MSEPKKHLRVDPSRRLSDPDATTTGIYTPAFAPNGHTCTAAIEELDKPSLLQWLKTRNSRRFIEDVVGRILGHGELNEAPVGRIRDDVPLPESVEGAYHLLDLAQVEIDRLRCELQQRSGPSADSKAVDGGEQKGVSCSAVCSESDGSAPASTAADAWRICELPSILDDTNLPGHDHDVLDAIADWVSQHAFNEFKGSTFGFAGDFIADRIRSWPTSSEAAGDGEHLRTLTEVLTKHRRTDAPGSAPAPAAEESTQQGPDVARALELLRRHVQIRVAMGHETSGMITGAIVALQRADHVSECKHGTRGLRWVCEQCGRVESEGFGDEVVASLERATTVRERSNLTQVLNHMQARLARAEAGWEAASKDAAEMHAAMVAMRTADSEQPVRCIDCKHFWERRGLCTRTTDPSNPVDPLDPDPPGPGRPWREPHTCAPPWCPGFERREPEEVS